MGETMSVREELRCHDPAHGAVMSKDSAKTALAEIERLTAEVRKDIKNMSNQREEIDRLTGENERLNDAIVWALGYTDFKPRPEGKGPYYWRTELRERCGDALRLPDGYEFP